MSRKKKLINIKVITYVIGSLLLVTGSLMLLCVLASIWYEESDILIISGSAGITIFSGAFMMYINRKSRNEEIKKRDGYLIVVFGWVAMTLFGTLPYILNGAIPNYSDAFFESMSGFTTTGASILNDIEALPKGILLWRSTTQWIGGMGIIVLTIAILPLLGIGGMELFVNEAPGPTKDKIHPRIKETAKRLWIIYLGLTVLEIILLDISGMTFFDALNHGLTTMSTGGFSTKNTSVVEFNPLIQYIILVFMFIAGTNFTLLYFGMKGKLSKLWKNDEFRWYLMAVIGLVILITPIVYFYTDSSSIEKSFRDVLFQVIGTMSTTGYASAFFTHWGTLVTFLFFMLLFTGASAGSTSGGIKLVRIVLLFKNAWVEFKRRLHPNAIIPVYLNKDPVPDKITYNLLTFIFLFFLVFIVGSIAMIAILDGVTVNGVEFTIMESLSATATALGNVGPGIGKLGPDSNFSAIPSSGKWLMSFMMLCGRLELFTVLLIFTPFFWRRI